MTELKIKRSIYVLIGLTVLILIGMVLGWFFVLASPQNGDLATVLEKYKKRKAIADTLKAKLEEQRKAEDRKKYVDAQLEFFRGSALTNWKGRYRTFRYDDIGADPATLKPQQRANRNEAFGRALREYFSSYGEDLGKALRDQANAVPAEGGRRLIFSTAVKVDAPPKAPEDLVVPPNGLLKPTSTTTNGALSCSIKGTFTQIKDFLNRVNRAEILFVVGNVKLTGTTPEIEATFTLTPYLLATGSGAQKLTIAAAAAPEGGEAKPAGEPTPTPTPGG